MASGLPTAFRHIKDNQKPLRFNSKAGSERAISPRHFSVTTT